MKKLLIALPLMAGLTMGLLGCGDSPEPAAQAPIADTGLVAVDSSAFSQVGYNAVAEELTLVFSDGNVYVYSGISADLAAEFMSADSLGGFYHANIRDQFESTQQ